MYLLWYLLFVPQTKYPLPSSIPTPVHNFLSLGEKDSMVWKGLLCQRGRPLLKQNSPIAGFCH